MMTNIRKNLCKYPGGTIIIGKWQNKKYHLLKELGSGANGVVYLAKESSRHVALKMSMDSYSITSEVNVLKALAKVQGYALGPFLYEMDDWDVGSKKIHFYVMEYINGPDLLSFVSQKGRVWAGIMVLQLLDILERLHKQGWIFGDLKPENLIVTGPTPHIRCIDVGGTTMNGRAVKEFTEFYDRGYWELGSRKADIQYDLFSTAMLIINLYYPKRFVKKEGGIKQLQRMISLKDDLIHLEPILNKALHGEYQSALAMKSELLAYLSDSPVRSKQRQSPMQTRQLGKKKKRGSFLETMAVILVTLSLYAFYIYSRVF
ncbi:serine/threonine protein kinase [Pseudogracilibacillus auburnensis]|uniref:serine/threonine protein kinase n=1 Tax=Pseudogracilibacillus auburnensis TaxID=1494959 RepID=UPI001A95E6E1|nr:protein kinase family protein [Pseudogracilibacillus auburnensis]MBO1004708.1 protein kinase family protein [Pseudogracilibacillus auburnensis]